MKNLDLNKVSVQELDSKEMKEVNGGTIFPVFSIGSNGLSLRLWTPFGWINVFGTR